MVNSELSFATLLDERNEEYVAVDVAEMDITDAEKVDEVFAEVKPTSGLSLCCLHSR